MENCVKVSGREGKLCGQCISVYPLEDEHVLSRE